jgi:hypothetical protein
VQLADINSAHGVPACNPYPMAILIVYSILARVPATPVVVLLYHSQAACQRDLVGLKLSANQRATCVDRSAELYMLEHNQGILAAHAVPE